MPVLLIASSAEGELAIDRIYRERIGPAGESLARARRRAHQGAGDAPVQVAARVTAFIEEGLGR